MYACQLKSLIFTILTLDKPMVRRTKEEAQKTREAILAAAAKIFVEQGVTKTSLDSIAKEAGFTRGAVYWHFKNKLEIFRALHEQLFTSTIEQIAGELVNQHPDPLLQLEELCIDLLKQLKTNPQKRRTLTIFFLRCDYSGEMEQFLTLQKEQKEQSFALFSHYFERAIEKGQLSNKTDPVTLTKMLSFYITGIAIEYLRYPDLFDIEETAEQLISTFIKGVKQG